MKSVLHLLIAGACVACTAKAPPSGSQHPEAPGEREAAEESAAAEIEGGKDYDAKADGNATQENLDLPAEGVSKDAPEGTPSSVRDPEGPKAGSNPDAKTPADDSQGTPPPPPGDDSGKSDSGETPGSGKEDEFPDAGFDPDKDPTSKDDPTGRQCVRPDSPGRGAALNLLETSGAAARRLAYRPISILVTVKRLRGKEETTTSCTGVLTSQRMGFGLIDGDELKGGEVRFLLFPRISIAKHCMISEDEAPIVSLKLSLIGGPEVSEVYRVEEDGTTTRMLDGKEYAGMWFLDRGAVKTKDERDPCSQETTRSGTDTGEGKETACFSVDTDRVEIVSTLEKKVRANAKKHGFYSMEGQDYADARRGVTTLYDQQGAVIDWARLFAMRQSRYAYPLYHSDFGLMMGKEDYVPFNFLPASEEEAYELLDERLKSLTVTRLSRATDEPATFGPITRGTKSWKELGLKLYGSQEGDHYIVRAVGFEHEDLKLHKGDSGTMMIGHFVNVSKPVLTVYEYNQVLGVLSTVGGVDVCTGDDLLCCEKI